MKALNIMSKSTLCEGRKEHNKVKVLNIILICVAYTFGYFQGSISVGYTTTLYDWGCRANEEESDLSSLIAESCDPISIPEKYMELYSKVSTDSFTPFHEYFAKLSLETCEECPLAHKWIPYFEAYHDRFKRFRNKNVVFMEIGVQSGGSILMWRKYFGNGLHYIGLDINPETQRFDNGDWVSIHIGDSGDPDFLNKIRELYPDGVDILLDDGGHTMDQQIRNFQHMTDFVRSGGIFVCEDLATSYHSKTFGGINGDVDSKEFINGTMVGRVVHRAVDWLHVGYRNGNAMSTYESYKDLPQDLYPGFPEYQNFLRDFKSMHLYNQIVFFERGRYHQSHIRTRGVGIGYGKPTDIYSGYKLPWDKVELESEAILKKDKLDCSKK